MARRGLRLQLIHSRLGIKRPDVSSSMCVWYNGLPVLAAFADERELEAARELSQGIEEKLKIRTMTPNCVNCTLIIFSAGVAFVKICNKLLLLIFYLKDMSAFMNF